jgi:hypothetical protein
MSRFPGLFREVSLAVCYPQSVSKSDIERLLDKLGAFRADMLKCRTHLHDVIADISRPTIDCSLVYELFATSLVALAAANRLLYAIGSLEGQLLESDALAYAAEVIKMESDMINSNGWASFYLSQKMSMAAAIPTSTATWINEPGHIIEQWRFHNWCKGMQRDYCCSCNASEI